MFPRHTDDTLAGYFRNIWTFASFVSAHCCVTCHAWIPLLWGQITAKCQRNHMWVGWTLKLQLRNYQLWCIPLSTLTTLPSVRLTDNCLLGLLLRRMSWITWTALPLPPSEDTWVCALVAWERLLPMGTVAVGVLSGTAGGRVSAALEPV